MAWSGSSTGAATGTATAAAPVVASVASVTSAECTARRGARPQGGRVGRARVRRTHRLPRARDFTPTVLRSPFAAPGSAPDGSPTRSLGSWS
ncbi:hypothetical protein Kpho01_35480 [Kitasatospora phosalacinea]|uniref:Uncharacterized protein n=1 Tax=Kitasatospora phosalacinea TaxID=2065 RepID=A0A9W6PIN9_9ACTN|nr:hypothetical protein Kpho01_35480 [Kitasatospora phosalacinea]